MKRFLVSPAAKRDLDGIATYLAEHGGDRNALAMLSRLRSAMAFLGRTPLAGHLRPDLTSRALRFWPVSSFLIIYDFATKPIVVVRVLHAARDVRKLL